MNYIWHEVINLTSKSYTCGHCGEPLASEKGYSGRPEPNHLRKFAYIYICHHCNKPTYFDHNNRQIPGTRFGKDVLNIEDQGVSELDQGKLPSLLELKYSSSADAANQLGGIPKIRDAFVNFQRQLY